MSDSRAVIFDVDGVLVDSYTAHYDSWRELAAQRDWRISEEQFAATFGRTSREVIAELWSDEQLTDAQIAALDHRKESLYREILRRSFPSMDGAAELIHTLADHAFRLAVGSSGPPENVHLVLKRVDPQRRMQAVVTGDDVTRGKPDPQVFRVAAERLAVSPRRCVVVEDAPAGVAAARAADMACIALASTGRTRVELERADLVVDSLQEITPDGIDQIIRRRQCAL